MTKTEVKPFVQIARKAGLILISSNRYKHSSALLPGRVPEGNAPQPEIPHQPPGKQIGNPERDRNPARSSSGPAGFASPAHSGREPHADSGERRSVPEPCHQPRHRPPDPRPAPAAPSDAGAQTQSRPEGKMRLLPTIISLIIRSAGAQPPAPPAAGPVAAPPDRFSTPATRMAAALAPAEAAGGPAGLRSTARSGGRAPGGTEPRSPPRPAAPHSPAPACGRRGGTARSAHRPSARPRSPAAGPPAAAARAHSVCATAPPGWTAPGGARGRAPAERGYYRSPAPGGWGQSPGPIAGEGRGRVSSAPLRAPAPPRLRARRAAPAPPRLALARPVPVPPSRSPLKAPGPTRMALAHEGSRGPGTARAGCAR
ncbi:PREDICTED: basic proline-rich protein-like [Pseudopodoces humilis]|uniref:basic proline-rich protein-like n=1 Tax=Pseudopodoces humilis TaxID=181119 RepID=UPI0006B8402C|nr:PREDICTED: basic proline-rich protein-like [Pseudopodoces humilis]